jgi:hypothetical protein
MDIATKRKMAECMDAMDNFLKVRQQGIADGTYYDDDEDDDQFCDPLAAPQQPFSDGAPQHIHEEPKKDLFR